MFPQIQETCLILWKDFVESVRFQVFFLYIIPDIVPNEIPIVWLIFRIDTLGLLSQLCLTASTLSWVRLVNVRIL